MIIVRPIVDSLDVLDISDESYFNEYKDYISNSRLSLINPDQGGSVEKYLANEKINSGSLLLGSAVHAEVLQPGEFNIIGGIHRPTAKLGLMADELAKYYPNDITDIKILQASDKVNYYKGKMNPNRIADVREKCTEYWIRRQEIADNDNNLYLDDALFIKYKGCVKSIKDNVNIQSLLHPEGLFEEPTIHNELAITIMFEAINTETGQVKELPFKAKLDNYTITDGDVVLNDLKTTGHLLQDFPESFNEYHYYRQMAVYAWLLRTMCGAMQIPIESLTANMLVVSTVPDFYSQVFKVKTSDIVRGFNEFKSLLHRVAEIYV